MTKQRYSMRYLPSLLGLLLLGACVSQTTSSADQAPKIEVDRKSAYYSESVGLRRLPPPHERGIEKIAVLYLPHNEVMLHYKSNWGFRKPRHAAHAKAVMPDFDFEEELLQQASQAPFVKLSVLTTEEARLADRASSSKWLDAGTIDETGSAMLAALRAKGVDQLLLVREPEDLWDFIEQPYDAMSHILGGAYLRSKGFVGQQWVGTNVFAGFEFLMFDTGTGQGIESGSYTQASREVLSLKLRGPFEAHTAAEKAQMATALRARMINNIHYMLLLLKVVPGADGAFLTYDPATDKPGGSGFPE